MIYAHVSGSDSPGAGTFSRDLTKTKSLQCRDFTWALHMEKSISPQFPGPRGDVVANDLCITELYPDLPEPVPHVNGSLVRTGKSRTSAFSIIVQISPH